MVWLGSGAPRYESFLFPFVYTSLPSNPDSVVIWGMEKGALEGLSVTSCAVKACVWDYPNLCAVCWPFAKQAEQSSVACLWRNWRTPRKVSWMDPTPELDPTPQRFYPISSTFAVWSGNYKWCLWLRLFFLMVARYHTGWKEKELEMLSLGSWGLLW